MMVEASCLMEQLGHAYVLDTCTCVIARKITFLFEIWIYWVGRACEATNQVEVA